MSKIQDAANWIMAHGTDKLQKTYQYGLVSEALFNYRKERLAMELPEWQFREHKTLDLVSEEDFNIEEVAELNRVKTTEPRAFLACDGKDDAWICSWFLDKEIVKKAL
jgi:hypothetical protein